LDKTDNVDEFSCKEEEIDEFIREQALGYQQQNLGVTYVFYFESKLVSFATLCMGTINKRKMAAKINWLKVSPVILPYLSGS
jgi:hypothetical protein